MTQRSFITRRYKDLELGFPQGINPPLRPHGPSVHRYRSNELGDGSGDFSGPVQPGFIGGSGHVDFELYNSDPTLTQYNSVCRFNDKIYTWFGNNIWRYDPQGESVDASGQGQWAIDASPSTSVASNGNHLGLYPVSVSGEPYLVTAAIEGTTHRMIRLNGNTGIWESGVTFSSAVTPTEPGVHAEIMHNGRIYYILPENTTNSKSLFLMDPENERFRKQNINANYPMAMTTFENSVYMLAKNVLDSGLGLFQVNEGRNSVGKVLDLNMSSGLAFQVYNFVGRPCLFTSTNPDFGADHMIAMYFLKHDIVLGVDGWQMWRIEASGNVFTDTILRNTVNPFPIGGPMNFTPFESSRDSIWTAWIDEQTNVGAGSEIITLTYRDNSVDQTFCREYQYLGPLADLSPVGSVLASGSFFDSQDAFSYVQMGNGGGHRIHDVSSLDIFPTGLQVQKGGNTKISFRVATNQDVPNGTPIAVRLYYNIDSQPVHKGIATIEAPSNGTITADNRNLITADSGTLYSFEWKTRVDNLENFSTINTILHASVTGVT